MNFITFNFDISRRDFIKLCEAYDGCVGCIVCNFLSVGFIKICLHLQLLWIRR